MGIMNYICKCIKNNIRNMAKWQLSDSDFNKVYSNWANT